MGEQTAIEWLSEQVQSKEWLDMFIWQKAEVLKRAITMERQQLNEYTGIVIKQALELAAKKAEIVNKAKFKGDYNPVVDEASITNTFEETFNKFKI